MSLIQSHSILDRVSSRESHRCLTTPPPFRGGGCETRLETETPPGRFGSEHHRLLHRTCHLRRRGLDSNSATTAGAGCRRSTPPRDSRKSRAPNWRSTQ